MPRPGHSTLAIALSATLGLIACVPGGAGIAVAERRVAPDMAQAIPIMNQFGAAQPLPVSRSNAEIAADFLDLSFQMESGRRIERLSRFEGPITIAVAPGAPASLGPDLDRLLDRLRREALIDIALVPYAPENANITIETLPRARMQRVVPQAACFVVPRVGSWAAFRAARASREMDWTTLETRDRVAVFVPNDVAPQEIRDCLHEEVAQAIGPLNDLYRLDASVFNDDNFHAVLTGFDMLILRVYNDAALRSGMTRAQVAAVLPDVLARLNPRGAGIGGAAHTTPTPRDWTEAIEAALGGAGTRTRQRRAAAERAVALARTTGLSETELAFSHFALGRVSQATDARAALDAFLTAAEVYDRVAPGGIQAAHVDMHLAAMALAAGDSAAALALSQRAIPAANRAQNAALLSTLLIIRAEALEAVGRPAEARLARLDSLAWGRYGFGNTATVGTRATEVAVNAP